MNNNQHNIIYIFILSEENSYNIEEEIIVEFLDSNWNEEPSEDTHQETGVVVEANFCEPDFAPEDTHLDLTKKTDGETPSTSTLRRRNIHNLAESVQEMNKDSIAVLKNIDKNLEGINNNLLSINCNLKKTLNFLLKQ